MNNPCLDSLIELRKEYGTSEFDHAVKTLMRQRIESGRGKKLSFKWTEIKRAYHRQRGLCKRCGLEMALDRNAIHGDHINPHLSEAEGLNEGRNCAALHVKCNLQKNANSIHEESKATGHTYREIIE